MARLTITLPDPLHQALKEAAARRKTTIGGLIQDALELYGIKTQEQAANLVARARQTAGLTGEEALRIATRETRAVRSR